MEKWSEKGSSLRWAVKVHRIITHRHRFNERALVAWEEFREPFEPLEHSIDFYLFQAPPGFSDVERMVSFIKEVNLEDRFALEIRNRDLLGNDDGMRRLGGYAVIVSVDSPDYQNRIFPGRIIYLRMHGRIHWYQYDYTVHELGETARIIRESGAKRTYVFFNNDHNMLQNARTMRDILDQRNKI